MIARVLAFGLLVVLGMGVVGTVSLLGDVEGKEAAASMPACVATGHQPGLNSHPVLIEAQMAGDKRQLLLMPSANEVAVKHGRRVEPIGPPCWYDDGRFYMFDRGTKKRIWLFAVVCEDEPQVRVVQ
jgi:hypothetical protein